MLEGVRRYRRWCEATGKVGTEVVMMAATFLGPEDPPRFLEAWAVSRVGGAKSVRSMSDRELLSLCEQSGVRSYGKRREELVSAMEAIQGARRV